MASVCEPNEEKKTSLSLLLLLLALETDKRHRN